MQHRTQDQSWVHQVPNHYDDDGPYEDYGWERGQSVLPAFRAPSVRQMPYERRAGMRRMARPDSWEVGGAVHDFGWERGMYPAPVRPELDAWRAAGPYTGRGPRNYQRSDDRICDDVCEMLTRAGDLDAREIEVTVENGEVTLQGTVHSRRDKRLAEDIAEAALGVRDIHNRLRIEREGGAMSPYF